MDPKGNVLIKREIVHTKFWPNEHVNFLTGEVTNLEKEYKEGLAGKMVTVMDIAIDGEEYLVLGHTKEGGAFLWTIDKKDTVAFIPVIKKYGTLMPAGLSPMEEFEYLAKSMSSEYEEYRKKFDDEN